MRKPNRENGKCPGKVCVLQAMCWGTLFLVQLFLIRCLETQAAEPVGQDPIRVWEFRMVSLPSEEIPVERDVIYENVEALARVPEFMEFALEENGRKANVSCWADGMEVVDARWKDDFSFPVTFHDCDAEFCQLGDVLIPYVEEKPELEEHESLLLDLIDVPKEAYRVTDISWNGELYTDESGVLCRDALAVGDKLVQDFQVHYVGTAEFPACEGWQIVAEYELPVSELKETDVSVIHDDENLSVAADGQQEFWKNVIRTLTVAFSLLLLLLIVILLVKQRKMRYTKHDCENANRRVDK